MLLRSSITSATVKVRECQTLNKGPNQHKYGAQSRLQSHAQGWHAKQRETGICASISQTRQETVSFSPDSCSFRCSFVSGHRSPQPFPAHCTTLQGISYASNSGALHQADRPSGPSRTHSPLSPSRPSTSSWAPTSSPLSSPPSRTVTRPSTTGSPPTISAMATACRPGSTPPTMPSAAGCTSPSTPSAPTSVVCCRTRPRSPSSTSSATFWPASAPSARLSCGALSAWP